MLKLAPFSSLIQQMTVAEHLIWSRILNEIRAWLRRLGRRILSHVDAPCARPARTSEGRPGDANSWRPRRLMGTFRDAFLALLCHVDCSG
jgi:hypothetical protein